MALPHSLLRQKARLTNIALKSRDRPHCTICSELDGKPETPLFQWHARMSISTGSPRRDANEPETRSESASGYALTARMPCKRTILNKSCDDPYYIQDGGGRDSATSRACRADRRDISMPWADPAIGPVKIQRIANEGNFVHSREPVRFAGLTKTMAKGRSAHVLSKPKRR